VGESNAGLGPDRSSVRPAFAQAITHRDKFIESVMPKNARDPAHDARPRGSSEAAFS